MSFRTRGWFLVLPVVLFLSPPARAADDPKSRGLQALRTRDYGQAFEHLNTAYSADSGDARVGGALFLAAVHLMREAAEKGAHEQVLHYGDWADGIDSRHVPESSGYASGLWRGRALLALGRVRDAVSALESARSQYPHVLLTVTLAQAYYKDQQWAPAAGALREYLDHAESKRELTFFHLLAMSLYRSGDLVSALKALDEGLAAYPGDATMIGLKERWEKEFEVEGGMQQGSTWHFQVLFENVEAQRDIRERILGLLEEAYNKVTRELGHYPKDATQVVIYSSREEYTSGVDGAPTWSAAVYNGKIRVPLNETKMGDRELATVLVHEFTHVMVDQIANRSPVPTWMNEGLAQHMENKDMTWAANLVRTRLKQARRGRGGLLGLTGLAGSFTGIRDRGVVNLAYAQSYLVTRHLVDTYGLYRVLQVFQDLGQGSSIEESFRWRFGQSPEAIEKKWLDAQ